MSTFSDALRTMTALPGALYSCVAEQGSGIVVAEDGARPSDAGPVLRWGLLVTESLAGHGDLEDLMITEERRYHLLRRIRAADRDPLLVYLHLDRARANLAQARRALSTFRPGTATVVPPQALPPRQESVTVRSPARTRLPTRRPGVPVRQEAGRLGRPTVALAPVSRPGLPTPHRPAPGAVPLPRQPDAARSPRAGVDLPGTAPEVSPIPAGGWSTDLHTMRRLLEALRRFD